jgi:hypothetical protein
LLIESRGGGNPKAAANSRHPSDACSNTNDLGSRVAYQADPVLALSVVFSHFIFLYRNLDFGISGVLLVQPFAE